MFLYAILACLFSGALSKDLNLAAEQGILICRLPACTVV